MFFFSGWHLFCSHIFKVAILPHPLFEMATKIVELYEKGDLVPPSSSKQRQRWTISYCFKRTKPKENSPLTVASVPACTKKGNGRETQTPQLFIKYYLPQAIFVIVDFIFFLTALRLNALILFIPSQYRFSSSAQNTCAVKKEDICRH